MRENKRSVNSNTGHRNSPDQKQQEGKKSENEGSLRDLWDKMKYANLHYRHPRRRRERVQKHT